MRTKKNELFWKVLLIVIISQLSSSPFGQRPDDPCFYTGEILPSPSTPFKAHILALMPNS